MTTLTHAPLTHDPLTHDPRARAPVTDAPGRGFGLLRTLGRIGDLFVSIAAARQAAADFEALSRRTDAELAARGLRRPDVAPRVFARHDR